MGDRKFTCNVCSKSYLGFERKTHHCGTPCLLCGIYIDEHRSLLHMLTDCANRHAQCHFCKLLRKTQDMKEHIAYCGSRSERCPNCNAWVALMNMEIHTGNNCASHSNKQLSDSKMQLLGKNSSPGHENNPVTELVDPLSEISLNDDLYLDAAFIAALDFESPTNRVMGVNTNSATQVSSTLSQFLNSGKTDEPSKKFETELQSNSGTSDLEQKDIILCPHCPDDYFCFSLEDFELHMISIHPTKLNDRLTHIALQTMDNDKIPKDNTKLKYHSNSDMTVSSKILCNTNPKLKRRNKSTGNHNNYEKHNTNNNNGSRRTNKQNERSKSSKNQTWSCNACTYINNSSEFRCLICQTFRSDLNSVK